jgi:hypothetical protein
VLLPSLSPFYVHQPEIKALEKSFFEGIRYESSLLFGGSLGLKSGGVTAFTLSSNGRLVAQAISNGNLLVYDTKDFELVRAFTAVPPAQFIYIEFSRDNYSQLLALT